MAISEVVAGLQQGTVDGFEMMITPLYTNGFYDLLDHCCLTQINFSVNPMLISETLFQSLSTEDQEILLVRLLFTSARRSPHLLTSV